MTFPLSTAAVAGTGFIGPVHVEALRRLGICVKGILGGSPAKSEASAKRLGLPKGYVSYDEILSVGQIVAAWGIGCLPKRALSSCYPILRGQQPPHRSGLSPSGTEYQKLADKPSALSTIRCILSCQLVKHHIIAVF